MTCALYRMFDADGRLLYVGVSLSAARRLSQHAGKPWIGDVARFEIEYHADRAAALVAEAHTIHDEGPAHNRLRPSPHHRPTVQRMSYVAPIIEAFGGVRPMAKAIGRPVSTVQSWKDRGSIPDEHKPDVLSEAHKRGLTLGPSDFFPIPKTDGAAA